MLYGYKYIAHDLDKLQKFLEHIVVDVWHPATGNFRISKINSDFRPLVQGVNKTLLWNPIKTVYNIYKTLPQSEKDLIQKAFIVNNDIQGLCDGSVNPIHYSKLKTLAGGGKKGKELANNIFIVCTSLYTRIPSLKPCYDEYGKLIERYHGFTKGHDINYCPFCGLDQILRENHTKRSDYDHFFPKELYPFTAINFHNLVPMCDDCNKRYKGRQDPINLKYGNLADRKHVLNPFNNSDYNISIDLNISHNSVEDLETNYLTLNVQNDNYPVESERWEEVFGIQERYKAEFVSPDRKTWLDTYRMMKKGNTHEEILEHFDSNTYADKNFLKRSFLDECHKKGLI